MNNTQYLNIKEQQRQIPYTCCHNAWELASQFVSSTFPRHALVVITDDTVASLHLPALQALLTTFPRYLGDIIIPAGEKSKNRTTKDHIDDELFARRLGRDTVLFAVGGGVIGDLAGYVAATFNRGIPLLHLPTTLLAMVDSSIGGKTGINHAAGKNLLGAFYQPEAIFADISSLHTLPEQELINGLAEVLKYAVTLDPKLWNDLEQYHENVFQRDSTVLQTIILRSAALKIHIVSQDEKESGLRAILNFGHTAGHAFEMLSEYTIPHGFAVAAGMRVALRLSHNLLGYPEQLCSRFDTLLDLYFLRHSYPHFSAESLWQAMLSDKKSRDGYPRFVLMRTESDYELSVPVTFEQFTSALEECQ